MCIDVARRTANDDVGSARQRELYANFIRIALVAASLWSRHYNSGGLDTTVKLLESFGLGPDARFDRG